MPSQYGQSYPYPAGYPSHGKVEPARIEMFSMLTLQLGLSSEFEEEEKPSERETDHTTSYSESYAPGISSSSPAPMVSRPGSTEPAQDYYTSYSYASTLPIISTTSSNYSYPTSSVGPISNTPYSSDHSHSGLYLPYQHSILSAQSSSQYLPERSTSETVDPSMTQSERIVDPPKESRCWDHGCNGRVFSTHSNYLRHVREKNGQAAKSTCPRCGAMFTRKTAMNGHMLHDKCKRRVGYNSSSDRSSRGSGNER
jgi:uncharacterized C2H2 Zn-finger protein